METKKININGEVIDLVIHSIDGETSEVYAHWDGLEIAFGYEVDDCIEKINLFFKVGG